MPGRSGVNRSKPREGLCNEAKLRPGTSHLLGRLGLSGEAVPPPTSLLAHLAFRTVNVVYLIILVVALFIAAILFMY